MAEKFLKVAWFNDDVKKKKKKAPFSNIKSRGRNSYFG